MVIVNSILAIVKTSVLVGQKSNIAAPFDAIPTIGAGKVFTCLAILRWAHKKPLPIADNVARTIVDR